MDPSSPEAVRTRGFGSNVRQSTAVSPSDPRDSQSWNRFIYTEGDPVNNNDPRGLGSVEAASDSPECQGEDNGDSELADTFSAGLKALSSKAGIDKPGSEPPDRTGSFLSFLLDCPTTPKNVLRNALLSAVGTGAWLAFDGAAAGTFFGGPVGTVVGGVTGAVLGATGAIAAEAGRGLACALIGQQGVVTLH